MEDRVSALSPAGAVGTEVLDLGEGALCGMWAQGGDLRCPPSRSPELCHPDLLPPASLHPSLLPSARALGECPRASPCVWAFEESAWLQGGWGAPSSSLSPRSCLFLLPDATQALPPSLLLWPGAWHGVETPLASRGSFAAVILLWLPSPRCPRVQGPALSVAPPLLPVTVELLPAILGYYPPVQCSLLG